MLTDKPLINKTLLALIERVFYRYLALDKETLKQLSTLSGKIIKLEFTNWNVILYLFLGTCGIQLSDRCDKTSDVALKGSFFDFLQVAVSQEKQTTAMKQLTIEGDLHLAHQFSKILQHMQINWEDFISTFTGDIVAHQIGSIARRFKRWGISNKNNFLQNMTEYLQEESGHLPPREAVEDFSMEVTRLQHDTARFEAKLQQFHKQRMGQK